jgi:hypothetical protein
MTFLELCQRLRQEVGAAGSGPAAVTGQHGESARLVGWIQQAWTDLQAKRPNWQFAWQIGEIEMEDGYREYALPADWQSFVRETIYLDDRRLGLLPWSEFRRRYRNPPENEPRHITVRPDRVLTLSSAVQLDVFLHQRRVGAFGHRRAGEHAQRRTRGQAPGKRMAGSGAPGHQRKPRRAVGGEVAMGEREAVDRDVVEAGDVARADQLLPKNAAVRRGQRNAQIRDLRT